MKKILSLALYLPRVGQTGTYNLADLRANDQTLGDFGIPNALAVLTAQIVAYNAQMNESLARLVEVTTERVEAAPVPAGLRMVRTDEYGNAATQKGGTTEGRGFPLETMQVATGWTEHFGLVGSVRDFMQMNDQAQLAHTTAIREDLARALYNPQERPVTETLTVGPFVRPEVFANVKVKPLYNGDDEVPPLGPNGKRFEAGHNHYLASDGLGETAVDELTTTVGEHSTGNSLVIYINEADAAAFRALSGFASNTVAQVIGPNNQVQTNVALDVSRTDDRHIGFTASGIPVWTKPWAIPGYALCLNLNGPRALKMRVPAQAVLRGLRLKGQEGNTVLKAQTWEASHGFGASNRGAAAILNFGPKPQGAPADVYAAPALVEE
ncbi:hypothetical protein DEIPH_ctg052orf0022 [Deinococcus phoenicis]|uniref:Major capsid protein n=1 Tax=Deinococcus phoenicis TaxID=1476583 RepID=A0A016QME6_9DEIO|nr:hypothetical protein [Deinococcus phoenicis]EYB67027.1 hypothetical protein DEIPH_ctg052orf0022 [Deinococcus phoenicis]